MKKYLGNAAVKGVIASAMTALLVVTAPVNVTAADAAAVIEFTDITDAAQENILDKDTVENKIEEALKDTDLTKEQKDLLKDLGGDISQVDTTQDSYDVVDDVKDIIHNDVTNAVTNEKNDAAAAADAAEEISDAAGNAASQVKQGETVTDTLLKDDQDIVKEVKGNTVISTDENGNETKLVNSITEEGKIILNVEDSDGNKVGLTDYTADKAAAAKEAADTVSSTVSNLNQIIGSDTRVSEARETIDKAITDATTARDDAKTAYDAASSVLTEEMKQYNAYAKFYGLDASKYSRANDNTAPEFTEEEYLAFIRSQGLTMNNTQTKASLDAANDQATKDTLAKQAEEIKAAQTLVDSCKAEIEEANSAIDQIVSAEQKLVSGIQNIIDQTTEQLKTATGLRKELLKHMQEIAQVTLDTYNKVDMGQEVHPTENDPDATNPDTFKNRFDYTIYQAKDLSKNLDDMVDQASKEVTDSAKRYDEAKAKYEEILKQYEALVNNNITSNLDALELKLANAKNELTEADSNLNEAQKALDTAASLKEQFENDIANSGNTSGSDDSGSTGSDSTASAATTAAASTVAIDDGATPLADGITDAASSDLVTLDDEATALADSVPKTGDTANAAIPFGFAAFAAFAGAFVTRMRRRNN